DPVSGQFSEFVHDDAADEFIINRGQVVDHIIEANKLDFNDAPRLSGGKDGPGARVASIPLDIYFELRGHGIVQDRKRFAKWLNDPDNRAWRTAPGSL